MTGYGIATLFENFGVGYEFAQDNIPLHLTHVDAFEIDRDADELANLLADSLAGQKAIEIRATNDALYGPNKDILVTEIERSPALLLMHTSIMKMLRDHGAIIRNPQFHNDGYRPHVSAYGSRRIFPGDALTIHNLIIATKTASTENALTRVVAKILV